MNYDFYYSYSQRKIQDQLKSHERVRDRNGITTIDGHEFTECVETGKKPSGLWTDYVLVVSNRPKSAIVEHR